MAARPQVLITPLRDAGAVDSRLRLLERENAAVRGVGGSYALRIEPGTSPAAALRSAQALLRADLAASRSPAGLDVRFTLDEPLARRLARVDGAIVGRKLLDAAERTIARQLDGCQGIVALRYEPVGPLDRPVVQAILGPTRTDGTPNLVPPPHTRIAIERAWRHETYQTFGLRIPTPQPEPERIHLRALEERWREASREFQDALVARIHGRLTQPEFAQVFLRTQAAHEAFAAAVQHRRTDAPVRLEVLHVRLENAAEPLLSLANEPRNALVQRAVAGVSGPGSPAPSVFRYPVGGGDLAAILYFEPGSIDRADLTKRIEGSLAQTLRREAAAVGLPEAPHLGIRVVLPAASEPRRLPERGPALPSPPNAAQMPPRHWMEGRIASVVVRVPNMEALANLGPDVQKEILQRAVDRAWPGFERAGVRGNFLVEFRGKELRLKILVPERQVEALTVLNRPLSAARITNEIHRGLADQAGARAPERVVLRPVEGLAPTPAPQASVELAERVLRVPGGSEERTIVGVHRIEGGARYLDRYAPADLETVVHAALRDAYQHGHPFEASRRLDILSGTTFRRHGGDLVVEVPAGRAGDGHWYERSLMGGPDAGAGFAEAFGRAAAQQDALLARESDLAARRIELARAAARDELGQRWVARTLRLGDSRLVQHLPTEVRRDVLREALGKAFPELRDRRLSANVEAAVEDRRFVARVAVPETHTQVVRALDAPDAPRRLAEAVYRDPRIPLPAGGHPPLERAGEVTIRVVEDRLRLADGTMVRSYVAVHRIEGGTEYLGRFSPAEQGTILDHAVGQAYPPGRGSDAGQTTGQRVVGIARGRDLELHVPLRRSRWWERKIMEGPAAGRRFSDALSAAVARHERRQLLRRRGPDQRPSPGGVSRLVDPPLRAMLHLRGLAEEPLRYAGQLGKDILISRAIPAPMRPVARVLARFIRRDE